MHFSEGCWPTAWKFHVIMLIFKRGAAFKTGNYRGVYLTTILSNIAEKFTGFASAADPNATLLESHKLEAQIAAWRVRLQPAGPVCSLEAQVAAWQIAGWNGGLELGGLAG